MNRIRGVARGRIALPAACAAVLLALAAAPVAEAYVFGEPGVRQLGPEVVVFDWTTDKCNNDDIPDQATRAFRDVNNQVVLVNSHHTTRRYQGATLATVTHNCSIMMGSGKNADPSMFDDREWLATTWTSDGRTVYGLIHSEYQGYNHEPQGFCIRSGEPFSEKQKCWYNTLTLTKSTNNGVTFSHATPPNHFVAGPPYPYARGIGPIGFFQPSNIVRGRDGYLYLLSHVQDYGAQPVGSCAMRTNNIDDPNSWRMWDGTGFTRRSLDPYRNALPDPPTPHVCQPVSPHVGTMSESVTWNTYFKKWMLVGSWQGPGDAPYPDSGFYYFLSDDLINWSSGRLLLKGRLPWTYQCSDGNEQIRDPSVLDTDSQSRNFDTTGQRPFIYFTRFHVASCRTSLDRDLIRIPIEFTNQQPGGPAAALSASTQSPQPGEAVRFSAAGSTDTDGGEITAYKWDLNGDGHFERDTGADPTTSKRYTSEDRVTVTVKVCDDDGKGTDETTVVAVGSGRPSEGPAQAGAGSPGGECPAPDRPAPKPGNDPQGSGPAPVTPGPIATGAARQAGPPVATGRPGTGAVAKVGALRIAGKPRQRARGRVLLKVRVPAAGTLTVRAAGRPAPLRRARRKAFRARTLNVVLRPTAAGLRALRERRRARARVRLVFRPRVGTAQRYSRTITLRPVRRR